MTSFTPLLSMDLVSDPGPGPTSYTVPPVKLSAHRTILSVTMLQSTTACTLTFGLGQTDSQSQGKVYPNT